MAMHLEGKETQWRAESMDGKAHSVLAGGARHDVRLLGHRMESWQELQHTACFSELSFCRASVDSESALWPESAYRELLRRDRWRETGCGHKNGEKGAPQWPMAADACCEAPGEAELEISLPSMEIRWSRSNSGRSFRWPWEHNVMKLWFRSP